MPPRKKSPPKKSPRKKPTKKPTAPKKKQPAKNPASKVKALLQLFPSTRQVTECGPSSKNSEAQKRNVYGIFSENLYNKLQHYVEKTTVNMVLSTNHHKQDQDIHFEHFFLWPDFTACKATMARKKDPSDYNRDIVEDSPAFIECWFDEAFADEYKESRRRLGIDHSEWPLTDVLHIEVVLDGTFAANTPASKLYDIITKTWNMTIKDLARSL